MEKIRYLHNIKLDKKTDEQYHFIMTRSYLKRFIKLFIIEQRVIPCNLKRLMFKNSYQPEPHIWNDFVVNAIAYQICKKKMMCCSDIPYKNTESNSMMPDVTLINARYPLIINRKDITKDKNYNGDDLFSNRKGSRKCEYDYKDGKVKFRKCE